MHRIPFPTRRAVLVAAACAMMAALTLHTGCGVIDSFFGDEGPSLVVDTPATPAPAEESTETAEVPTVQPATASDARKLIDDGARLISVDTVEDFRAERVSGARNIPLADLTRAAEDWNKTAPVLITSRAEARSRSAAGYLVRAGFEDIHFLRDGHDGWNGSFEGNDARVLTKPSKLYYLWSSRPVVIDDNASPLAIPTMRELRSNTLELADEFDGVVDIVTYDIAQSSQSREAWQIMQRYDIEPSMWVFGSPVQLVPTWILVDGDGRVSTNVSMNSDGHSIARMSSRSYGWMISEMERHR